jgi:hypothetical protein
MLHDLPPRSAGGTSLGAFSGAKTYLRFDGAYSCLGFDILSQPPQY